MDDSQRELAALEDRMARNLIGPPERLTGPIEIADYDAAWPLLYDREAARIRSALNDRVKRIAHVGSTSVPGLSAKPIIDIV
jgi:GrpB-like predicted nucleotidyltransferase (UPF0157 family)